MRGYGEPQKLLARTLLVRSPKRKSIRIFQNVINSIFQQSEKETSSDSAAEESDCTGRALACSAATPWSKGHTGQQRGPLGSAGKGGGAGSGCGGSFHRTVHGASHGQPHCGQHPNTKNNFFFKMSIFSPLYSLQKKFFWGRHVSSLMLVSVLQFVGLFQQNC